MSLHCVSRTIGGLLCIANAGIFATLLGMATLSVAKHHGLVACAGFSCAGKVIQARAEAVEPAVMSRIAKATIDEKI